MKNIKLTFETQGGDISIESSVNGMFLQIEVNRVSRSMVGEVNTKTYHIELFRDEMDVLVDGFNKLKNLNIYENK